MKKIFYFILKPFQFFLSLLYKNAMEWRNYVYFKNNLSEQYGLHTIAIGNLQMGGGGKTPLCIDLLKRFLKNDFNFIHSSRAYKSKIESKGLIIDANDENSKSFSSVNIGDEPKLILKYIEKGILSLGKKRNLLLRKISEKRLLKPIFDVMLLEDAYQHLKIMRDKNILLIDVTDNIEEFYIFPRGKLREGKKAIWRADLIVFTKINLTSVGNRKLWHECINEYKRSDCPVVEVEYLSQSIVSIDDQTILPINTLHLKNAVIFSAIANSTSFYNLVASYGVKILKTYSFPDHAIVSKSKYSEIVEFASKEDAYILCTEKDAVKMKSFPNNDKLFFVKLDIQFVGDGDAIWNSISNLNY